MVSSIFKSTKLSCNPVTQSLPAIEYWTYKERNSWIINKILGNVVRSNYHSIKYCAILVWYCQPLCNTPNLHMNWRLEISPISLDVIAAKAAAVSFLSPLEPFTFRKTKWSTKNQQAREPLVPSIPTATVKSKFLVQAFLWIKKNIRIYISWLMYSLLGKNHQNLLTN